MAVRVEMKMYGRAFLKGRQIDRLFFHTWIKAGQRTRSRQRERCPIERRGEFSSVRGGLVGEGGLGGWEGGFGSGEWSWSGGLGKGDGGWGSEALGRGGT